MPKYERMKRMAERFGFLRMEPGVTEAYMLMSSLVGEMHEAGGACLARHGLGEGRSTALAWLLEKLPEPVSHSQLADLLGVTKGSVTGLVDGLERDGYVKREDRGGDRRMRLISLTPAGRDLIEKALPEKFKESTGLLARLSPAERETLITLLRKVKEGVPAYQGV
jgi:DNA-binding MarR family transcriptional regulator